MERIVEWLRNYFNLYSSTGVGLNTASSKRAGTPGWAAWPQWLALLLGVVTQKYLHGYRTSGQWGFQWETFGGHFVFSVVVAVLVFPGVYKNAFDPDKPVMIQLIPIFTAGLGWEAMYSSVVEGGAQ